MDSFTPIQLQAADKMHISVHHCPGYTKITLSLSLPPHRSPRPMESIHLPTARDVTHFEGYAQATTRLYFSDVIWHVFTDIPKVYNEIRNYLS